MTDSDPHIRTTTTVERELGAGPTHNTYVRRPGSATPWVLAAIVAVVAIIAVAFLMSSRTDPTEGEIASALDASRAAGYVEGATTAITANAGAATMAADAAASRTAAEASAAAADARAAAERAANSANDAAADASARLEGEVVITEPVQ